MHVANLGPDQQRTETTNTRDRPQTTRLWRLTHSPTNLALDQPDLYVDSVEHSQEAIDDTSRHWRQLQVSQPAATSSPEQITHGAGQATHRQERVDTVLDRRPQPNELDAVAE